MDEADTTGRALIDPNHNADGTFAKGNTANGASSQKGWQKFSTRMKHFMTMTPGEIQVLVMRLEEDRGCMTMQDALCVRKIWSSMAATKLGFAESEAVIDRADGKAVQTTVTIENPYPKPDKFPTVEEAMAAYEDAMKNM